jgi:hypothetical protein
MFEKVCVFINSKNRAANEPVSNFNVVIPDALLRSYDKGEYWTLNVNYFSCFNSWYNCQTNFNDQFQLIYYDNQDNINETINLRLTEGNPDVYDIKNQLNKILKTHVNVNYDKPKNIYIYKRTSIITNDKQKLYLNIINAEDFLGFPKNKRNTLIELPLLTDVYSEHPINVIGDEAITISINGDVGLETSTIDNFSTNEYIPSDIIFCQPIDVPPYSLLQYANEDGGDSFQFRLKPIKDIKYFNLKIKNQDNELIPNMTDYILTLQFIKHKTQNKTETLLESILDYLKQMFMMIGLNVFPKLENNLLSLCEF